MILTMMWQKKEKRIVRHDVMSHVYAYGRAVPEGNRVLSILAQPPAM